ncbi:MATE family efflux transporter, partial [Oceaniovalibus guishaninsula]|uniref:MATE family efflux transporter n=1 Tax=Oceaniovalibus guishaninsula TaxID=1046117 RepID=UPI00058E4D79
MSTGRDLTRGPVHRAILSVTAPMVVGILGVIAVGFVDAIFLGMLGQQELAVVGFVYPVTTAIISLSIGLSAGANAALSQAIGAGATGPRVDRMGLHAMGLGLCLGL